MKRSPIKRKSPNARVKADVLFSRIIRARDHCCLRCGSVENLQAAHIWSRRYYALRWKPENCITLCQGCHLYFTLRPAEWAAWCEGRLFSADGLIPLPDNEWPTLWSGVVFSYSDLRYRALNDPPEKAADALERLKEPA